MRLVKLSRYNLRAYVAHVEVNNFKYNIWRSEKSRVITTQYLATRVGAGVPRGSIISARAERIQLIGLFNRTFAYVRSQTDQIHTSGLPAPPREVRPFREEITMLPIFVRDLCRLLPSRYVTRSKFLDRYPVR